MSENLYVLKTDRGYIHGDITKRLGHFQFREDRNDAQKFTRLQILSWLPLIVYTLHNSTHCKSAQWEVYEITNEESHDPLLLQKFTVDNMSKILYILVTYKYVEQCNVLKHEIHKDYDFFNVIQRMLDKIKEKVDDVTLYMPEMTYFEEEDGYTICVYLKEINK